LNEETQHHNASLFRTAKPKKERKKEKKTVGSYLQPQKTTRNCNTQAVEHLVHATVHVIKKKKCDT